MNKPFPITQTMQDQIKYISINSQILSGKLMMLVDRITGEMPTEDDVRRRFWSAFNKLNEEVAAIKAQRQADSLRAENIKLQERIKELELKAATKTAKHGKNKTSADNDIPF